MSPCTSKSFWTGLLPDRRLWQMVRRAGNELGLLEYILVVGHQPGLVHDHRVASRLRRRRPAPSQTATVEKRVYARASADSIAMNASRSWRFITLPLALRGNGSSLT